METRTEVARIREVYRQYTACHFEQSRWSPANAGNRAIRHEREFKSRERLKQSGFFPLTERRILDVGCGTGEQLGTFLHWGAKPENLFGIDLIPDRIRAAQHLLPQVGFRVGNAEALPFADGHFDLVTVFTVFSSILDHWMAVNVSDEINRVLAPGGVVLWYDFRTNNPFNRHVRGLSRRRIQQLFPGFAVALQTVSLLPPLARRLGVLACLLYAPLAALPFLRTHLLGLLTKPGLRRADPS